MNTPQHTDIAPVTIRAIVERFGLGTSTATRLAHRGASHTIYLLDDAFILRIPQHNAMAAAGIAREAIVVPAARAAGVHTPALIAIDDQCDLLPLPYAIYERVSGIALGEVAVAPTTLPQVWRTLGRDLARLHTAVVVDGPVAQLPRDTADLDPRPWLAHIAATNEIPAAKIVYLQDWLERLAPFALRSGRERLCHGDVNINNVLVHPQSYDYLALIDWTGAIIGDAAWDLAVVSLRVVPWLLEGYTSNTELAADTTLTARILWQHLRLALYGIHRAVEHNPQRVAQRIDHLIDNMHFFLAQPCGQPLATLKSERSDDGL